MTKIQLFSFLMLSVALTACGTTEKQPEIKEVIVTKVKRVVVAPPDSLLKDCTIDAPPVPKDFVKANYRAKEAMLVKHAGRQMVNLGKCNADKQALRDWKARELAKE